MPAIADPPPFTSAPLHAVVADLVEESGVSQRDLVSRVGLSKDQLSRTLKGSRHMSLEEAATILHEAGLPARGTLTLALFDRQDLAGDWARSGLGGFLETMVPPFPMRSPRRSVTPAIGSTHAGVLRPRASWRSVSPTTSTT